MIIFVFDRVENIVGKGENAGYKHVLLFLRCFQKVKEKTYSKYKKNITMFVIDLCCRCKPHCKTKCLTLYQMTKYLPRPN